MSPPGIDIVRVARSQRIVSLPRQAKLVRKWLDADALLARAQAVRREVDEDLRRRAEAFVGEYDSDGETVHSATYPIGWCHRIRDAVWNRLHADPLVSGLKKHGITWKKVFFIQDGSYFQNAIQCGNHLLDVAHNTVDAAADPVVFAPLEGLDYENLDTWSRYAAVAEKYYNIRLYPNLHFPLIFPLAPFLALRASGRLQLLFQQDMLFLLDMEDHWRRARALLADDSVMSRRLPAPYATFLQNFCGANDFAVFPLEYRESTPDSLPAEIESWNSVLHLSPRDQLATLKKIYHLTRQSAAILRRANLRPPADELSSLRAAGHLPPASTTSVIEESLSATPDFLS